MRVRRKALIVATVVGLGLTAAVWLAIPFVRATALILQAGRFESSLTQFTRPLVGRPIVERRVTIRSRHGDVRARVYRPASDLDRTLLLLHGVSPDGIDEPRLVAFARDLAGAGLGVVTPELPDLARYRITTAETDRIEDAAAWMAAELTLRADRPPGIVGISFAGGLSVVAAGRPSLRDNLAFVVSFGGHGDLPRVLRYLCTGRLPDGRYRAPHDYGLAVVLLDAADRLVPPAQAVALRDAVRTYLDASHLDVANPAQAQVLFDRARAQADALPEPAATLVREINARGVQAIGDRVRPIVRQLGTDPALSPERSPPPLCPVYLLHGEDDNVIPETEARLLAEHLAPYTRVRLLITPLLVHAEVEREHRLGDLWRMITFWSDLLRR